MDTKVVNGMIGIKCIFPEGSIVYKVLVAPEKVLNDFFKRNGLEKYRQFYLLGNTPNESEGVHLYSVTCTQKQAHVLCDSIIPPKQVGDMLITACRNARSNERDLCLLAHKDPSLVMDFLFININGTEFFNPKNLPADEFATEYVKIVNSMVARGVSNG